MEPDTFSSFSQPSVLQIHRQSQRPREYTSPLHRASVDMPGSSASCTYLQTTPYSAHPNLANFGEYPVPPPQSFLPYPSDTSLAGSYLEHDLNSMPTLYSTNGPPYWNPAPANFHSPQPPHTTNFYHQTLTPYQGIGEHLQVDPYTTSILPSNGNAMAIFIDQNAESANPAAGAGSSYLGANLNVIRVDTEATHHPLQTAGAMNEQPMSPTECIYQCQFREPDGTVCNKEVSVATLSEHLSEAHEIKNMSRAKPTKCQWVGCKRTKTMNRESIRRHIVEVHFRIKRLPRQVKETPV